MIKAIETRYAGCLFRSRLEARWAVFFDTLGIRWEYEKEGYDLGEAGWYLPDFWLPRPQCFVEIKGVECSDKDRIKCETLHKQSGFSVFIAVGNIGEHQWIEFGGYWKEKPASTRSLYANGFVDIQQSCLLCPVCGSNYVSMDRDRSKTNDLAMYCESNHSWRLGFTDAYKGHTRPAFRDVFEHVHSYPDEQWEYDLQINGIDTNRSNAITAARSARFEHGESGAR